MIRPPRAGPLARNDSRDANERAPINETSYVSAYASRGRRRRIRFYAFIPATMHADTHTETSGGLSSVFGCILQARPLPRYVTFTAFHENFTTRFCFPGRNFRSRKLPPRSHPADLVIARASDPISAS